MTKKAPTIVDVILKMHRSIKGILDPFVKACHDRQDTQSARASATIEKLDTLLAGQADIVRRLVTLEVSVNATATSGEQSKLLKKFNVLEGGISVVEKLCGGSLNHVRDLQQSVNDLKNGMSSEIQAAMAELMDDHVEMSDAIEPAFAEAAQTSADRRHTLQQTPCPVVLNAERVEGDSDAD